MGGPLVGGDRFNPLALGDAPIASDPRGPHAHGATADRAFPQPAENDAGRNPGRGSFLRPASEGMQTGTSGTDWSRAPLNHASFVGVMSSRDT